MKGSAALSFAAIGSAGSIGWTIDQVTMSALPPDISALFAALGSSRSRTGAFGRIMEHYMSKR